MRTFVRPLLPLLLLCLPLTLSAAPLRPSVRTITDRGERLDEIIVPGRPPAHRMPAVRLPLIKAAGVNVLSNVPALDWSYGCSATSAAMMFGYYDNAGYPNMYSGPTNGGSFPLTNAVWGSGECPLSATREGLDGRPGRGHVDDYWIGYNSSSVDPWITNNWAQHSYGDCTGDYMGTNQSALGNVDGGTTFYYRPDGAPLVDYTSSDPSRRDGCHGMRMFAVSRGYAVAENYNQYIAGYNGNTRGFTFAQYQAEIDAGRPVMIQVTGHSMLGIGYDSTTNTVYLHDTWDYSNHTMTWGGSYDGMAHYAVGVLQLQGQAPQNTAPSAPAAVTIGPDAPTCTSTLQATAAGSMDAEGDRITYEYQWSLFQTGSGWSSWGHTSTDGRLTGVELRRGQQWRVQARASDGQAQSDWVGATVSIRNSVPADPQVSITPGAPTTIDNLIAVPTATDADGDTLSYQVEWASAPEGGSYSAWGDEGVTLSADRTTRGQSWKARVRATDGADASAWAESAPVAIANSAPSPAPAVSISPLKPTTAADLRAIAAAASDPDGDPLVYRYQWSRSTDGGESWSTWQWVGKILSRTVTTRGEQWRVRCLVSDGSANSGYCVSGTVTILNSKPSAPSAVTVTPATPGPDDDLTAAAAGSSDADDDSLTYSYQWRRSRDDGATWSSWSFSGATISSSLTVPGNLWQVRARVSDGTATSGYRVGDVVTIGASAGAVAGAAVPGAALGAVTVQSVGEGVSVVVSLSAPAQVQAEVCNLAGRVVARLPEQSLQAGVSALAWNGRSNTGTVVPPGSYLLRVTAHGSDGAQSQRLVGFSLGD